MVVVIDANILISGCLKISGRISNLIFSYSSLVNYAVPAFVISEIKENEMKIGRSNKLVMLNS